MQERSVMDGNDGLEAGDRAGIATTSSDGDDSTGTTNNLPALPFDFNRFLEQLRMRSAEPISKYLRSFLREFQKRRFERDDQVRVINDFLVFIADKMKDCEPWKTFFLENRAEFDNATEAMEKLVMNRVYPFTFPPEIGRRSSAKDGYVGQELKAMGASSTGSGSESRATSLGDAMEDDLERDRKLKHKIGVMRWIREEHLDVPSAVGRGAGKGFLDFAQQELNKINDYKAPRDKLICILNCCKVIFGLIKHIQTEALATKEKVKESPTDAESPIVAEPTKMRRQLSKGPFAGIEAGADAFLPILILIIIRANPDHLVSNEQFISHFRNPEKLQSEAGYYLSSLSSAIYFIENLEASSLSNITAEEFESNIELAVEQNAKEEEHIRQIIAQAQLDKAERARQAENNKGSGTPLSTEMSLNDIEQGARQLFAKVDTFAAKTLSRIFSEPPPQTDGSGSQNTSQSRPPSGAGQSQRNGGLTPPLGYAPRAQRMSDRKQAGQAAVSVNASEADGSKSSLALDSASTLQVAPSTSPTPGGDWQSNTSTPLSSMPSTPLPQPTPVVPSKAAPFHQRWFSQTSLASLSSVTSGRGTPVEDGALAHSGSNRDLSAIEDEIEARSQRAHQANLETLDAMFPDIDKEVIEAVLQASGDQLSPTIDALLEMSNASSDVSKAKDGGDTISRRPSLHSLEASLGTGRSDGYHISEANDRSEPHDGGSLDGSSREGQTHGSAVRNLMDEDIPSS